MPHEHAENTGTRRRRPQNQAVALEAVALDPLENTIGTFRTCGDFRVESACGGKAEVGFRACQGQLLAQKRPFACLGFARSGLPRYGYGDDARVVFLLDFRVTGAPLRQQTSMISMV